MSEFDRSTDHDGKDGVGVLNNRGTALPEPLREILVVSKRSR